MQITPFSIPGFGATVIGVDCAELAPGQADTLRNALYREQVLVFPDQGHLLPAQEVEFYLALDTDTGSIWRDQVNNPWEVFKVVQGNTAGTYQLPGEPGVLVLGKGAINHHGLKVTLGGSRNAYGKDSGSQVLGGGALQWHIDGTFYEFEPCNFTQMYCVEAPGGVGHWLEYSDGTNARLWCEAGSTAFASGRNAWNSMDQSGKKSALQTCVHYKPNPFQATYQLGNTSNGLRVEDVESEQLFAQGKDVPGTVSEDPKAKIHPLVWTCPVTKIKSVMAQPRCIDHLETDGVHLGLTQSRLQLENSMLPAINPDSVYVHAWQPGDLVIWNNRSVWHSATGKLAANDRRIQHLTACNGKTPPR